MWNLLEYYRINVNQYQKYEGFCNWVIGVIMNIEEFIKANPIQGKSKSSRLINQRENILRLKNDGYTERKILEFLALNNIEVTQSTLNKFIRKQIDDSVAQVKKTEEDSGTAYQSDPLERPDCENSDAGNRVVQSKLAAVTGKKRELVEINGRVIDVNYKPPWVDDDINLKDLL